MTGIPLRDSNAIELWVFRASPLGPVATVIGMGLLVYGAFLANIWITADFTAFVADPNGAQTMRLAFILTLIYCAVLGVSYFEAQASQRDNDNLRRIFALEGVLRQQNANALRNATIGGLICSAIFLGFMIWTNAGGNVLAFLGSIGFWFAIMTPILWVQLARGVVASVFTGNAMAALIKEKLEIDLYRHHELAIFGRIAMRGAFVWLIFVGIILLFFINNEGTVFAQPTLGIAISIAVFNFVSTMQPVRRKIRAAKEVELGRIRMRLAEARKRLDSNGDVSGIPALIALETRIEQVREWPMDLPTAARLPLYLLIPIVPWVGAGFAETMLGNIFGGG